MARRLVERLRKLHPNAATALHHVRIGDDVTVRAQNDAGTAAPLARKQTGVAAVALIAERIPRRKDLYYSITRATGQRFERHAQITQRIGWLAFNSPLSGL